MSGFTSNFFRWRLGLAALLHPPRGHLVFKGEGPRDEKRGSNKPE